MLVLFFCGECLLHITKWLFFFFSPSGEFFLHIPCWLHFSMGSFSYTSHACLIFLWGVSLTHPVLASYLCVELFLNIRYWLYLYLGSFSYTSHACFLFLWGVCLTYPELVLSLSLSLSLFWAGFIFMRGVSLTHAVLAFFFLGGGGGACLAHPALALFFYGEFFLHLPFLFDFSLGSFSYTSHAGFVLFIWGVSLTHPVLASFLTREFLFHIPSGLLILYREFLRHNPWWLYSYLGSFSCTSHAGFIFLWGVSLTHPMLAPFFFFFFSFFFSF